MLSSLTLTNVALIKKQTIDFKAGFNCLLGQSGAGKSIVIDALSFSLGAKADKNLIRSGEDSMRVDATFVDVSKDVKDILNEFEIEYDDELLITRTLSLEGKSTVRINGFPVTAKMLLMLSEKLMDFCGQHDSVGLLKQNLHLQFLDKFGGREIEELKNKVSIAYDYFKNVEREIKDLGGSEEEREREKNILNFQIEEIENAHLQLGEEEYLKERLELISSSEKIYENVNDSLNMLDVQRDNAVMQIYNAKNCLSNLPNLKEIEECKERLENCYYELKDIVEVLESVKQSTDFDENELERVDARLDVIKRLSKKYGRTVEEVLDFQSECQNKLDAMENQEFTLSKLEKDYFLAEEDLKKSCEKLSELRKNVAENFSQLLIKELNDLEMKGTSFKVEFDSAECTRKGSDVVKFMFSANQGQALKELSKTASGGELSRLLLAFKNVMLDKENVQTVVFDEIDSGISGHTAGKLAEKLVNISKYTQILCITHTPVVASKANKFLLVEKQTVESETISSIRPLKDEEAVKEVARLIDGKKEVSETAIEHAKKLFEKTI